MYINIHLKIIQLKKHFTLSLVLLISLQGYSQNGATVTVDVASKGAVVSPDLHGIFFEEISHGGDGGLYGELIQNRGFEDSRLPLNTTLVHNFIVPDKGPHFSLKNNESSDWKMEWKVKSPYPAWHIKTNHPEDFSISLTDVKPLHEASPHSLQINITNVKAGGRYEIMNEGYWGINTVKGDDYNLSFFARTDGSYNGPVQIILHSEKGEILAKTSVAIDSKNQWKKYSATLHAQQSDGKAQLIISFGTKGTIWLDMVSLFPAKTFKNRPNGLRNDLAQYIADMKPAFVRWPGGCFVEGINVQNTPNWKKSLGPLESRPGTYSVWGYWSTDGFGYHEYLQFCEDVKADALYVFNIGVSCDFRSGTFVPDDKVDSVINDILDGIEYALGPVTTKYGKLRAANGHPAPFPLKYIEVGNEQSGPRYAERYNRFCSAIQSKYPQLKIVASMGIGDVNKHTLDKMKQVSIVDEHAYKAAGWAMNNTDHFDKYARGNWDMYVGEYATNNGVGAGNMKASLSDAVYIMSMERNSDLVKMSSYAPLFVNVNDIDWPVNLINYNADKSFARISYYLIKMFNENRPSYNVTTTTVIPEVKNKKPLFTGSIGLATWDTQSEYKDITVTKDGKVLYESKGFTPSDWKMVRGTWSVNDGVLGQTAQGAQRLAWLKNKNFDTYTLTLKARKTGGTNAFIIPFAVKDDATQLRAHIGSWVNSNAVFESVTNGFDVAAISQTKRIKPIEEGRWYSIRVEVGLDEVKCYLDDELLMTYIEPPHFFSIAGLDEKSGDIIIKAVNTSADPYNATIHLKGIEKVNPVGQLITLQSESLLSENSFEHPEKYVPQAGAVKGVKKDFTLSLKPYSINVFRISTK